MLALYALAADVVARPAPAHNGGSGGVTSGPWLWLGIAFIVIVGAYVAVRAIKRQRQG